MLPVLYGPPHCNELQAQLARLECNPGGFGWKDKRAIYAQQCAFPFNFLFNACQSNSHPHWARETLLSMAPVISTWYSMVNSPSSNTWPICCCSVAQLCPTLCNPMDCYTPGFYIHHCLPNLLICICCQSHPPTDISLSLDFNNMSFSPFPASHSPVLLWILPHLPNF